MDLCHAGPDLTIEAGRTALLPTGFCMAIPEGYEGQIRLRSGFALETGLVLPNAPGTIDSDYRGEVKVLVLNAGPKPVLVTRGQRVAQLVISPVVGCDWSESGELPVSSRGSGGFGSTGTK